MCESVQQAMCNVRSPPRHSCSAPPCPGQTLVWRYKLKLALGLRLHKPQQETFGQMPPGLDRRFPRAKQLSDETFLIEFRASGESS